MLWTILLSALISKIFFNVFTDDMVKFNFKLPFYAVKKVFSSIKKVNINHLDYYKYLDFSHVTFLYIQLLLTNEEHLNYLNYYRRFGIILSFFKYLIIWSFTYFFTFIRVICRNTYLGQKKNISPCIYILYTFLTRPGHLGMGCIQQPPVTDL